MRKYEKMRTTLYHIAKELSITPATVSRALNNDPRISKKTTKLVLETATRLNYRRNRIATSLRTGKSHTVGVIIPSARINFFGSVVHGIETLASEYGYHTIIYQSEETEQLERKAIEAFLSAQVDGILVSHAKEVSDFSHFLQLKEKNIPLVFFDRTNDTMGLPSVVVDDYKGGYVATEHLIQQGYKRIAHLAGPLQFQVFNNRMKGYRDALQAYNMEVDESLIFTGNISIEKGREAADYFVQMNRPPDAVFAVEDFSALGLMKRLKELKIKIPGEMGIIGFANEDFDDHITPTLSSIDQQTIQMGREAFRLLVEIIQEGTTLVKAKKIVLDPVPVFRESSLKN